MLMASVIVKRIQHRRKVSLSQRELGRVLGYRDEFPISGAVLNSVLIFWGEL
jgi:hypothetical protein